MRKSGFSLIELLVVVVIIGILGSVGTLGYLTYISQARDGTTKDNFEFLKRTLDQDIVSVANDLAARSGFSEGLTKSSRCFELRDRYISDINAERSNPFNKNKGQVCDGNHYMSYALEGNPGTQKLTIKRGQTMVYCTGTDIQAASWKTVSNNLGLKFCTCTGLDECETTIRYEAKLAAAAGPGTNVTITLKDLTQPAEGNRLKRLLVGDEVVDIDLGTYVSSTPNHTVDIVSLTKSHPTDTAVFEVNSDYCFTPLGDTSSLANYRADFSTLGDNATALPDRHKCY